MERFSRFFDRLGIYRNPRQGWITGVCAGFGDRFNVKPLWIRIGFAVLTLILHVAFPTTIILYLLLAFLMKSRDSDAAAPAPAGTYPAGTYPAGVQTAYRDLAETVTAPLGPNPSHVTGLKARFAALDARLNHLEAAVMTDELSLRRKFKDIGG